MSFDQFEIRWGARAGTAADLATVNEVPLLQEPIFETDTGRLKLGDGVTNYNDLPYIGPGQIDFTGIGDGKVLSWDAANSRFRLSSQSAVGGVSFVGQAEVTGAAATALTISGLDLSADTEYLVHISLKNATASSAGISLFYNGDFTAANYWRQTLFAGGTTTTPQRANDGGLVTLSASTYVYGTIFIASDLSGRPRCSGHIARDAPSSLAINLVSHIRDVSANVTSITLSSSIANALDVGSLLRVFRMNE